MANKKIKEKSKCVDCMANKSFSDKTKHKSEHDIIVLIFNKLNLIRYADLLCKV